VVASGRAATGRYDAGASAMSSGSGACLTGGGGSHRPSF
jgi:hypothetical protein